MATALYRECDCVSTCCRGFFVDALVQDADLIDRVHNAALGGWRGVHGMIEQLKQEFALAMKLSGAAKISDINAGMLVPQATSIRLQQ
jgi:hypothetical protein